MENEQILFLKYKILAYSWQKLFTSETCSVDRNIVF